MPNEVNKQTPGSSTFILSVTFIKTTPSLFLNRCVLVYVDGRFRGAGEMVRPLTIVSITDSSVKVSIIPQNGTTASKYRIKYRKIADSVWRWSSSGSSLSRTIADLEANTLYELKVVVTNRGKTLASQSIAVQTKVTEGK